MGTDSEKRPQIFVDLGHKKPYNINNYKMVVGKLDTYDHPTYIQFLDSNIPDIEISPKGSFDVSSFQINNYLTLKKKIEDVSTVTVHFDKKENEVLLFEVLLYKGDESIFRYFARKKFSNEEKLRWVEYRFKDDGMLDNKNIEKLMDNCKNFEFLNNIKIEGSYLAIVGVYSLIQLPCKKHVYEEGYINTEDFLFGEPKNQPRPKNLKGTYGIPFFDKPKDQRLTKDLEGQTYENVQEEKEEDFIHSPAGMTTVITSGSVGGVAIGGSLIYLVTSFK